MKTELKLEIIQQAATYMQQHNIAATQLAKLSGINESYLSNMLRGIFTQKTSKGEVSIADKWFMRLADTIGYKIQKTYWETVITPEFREIITALEEAKQHTRSLMIIGNTGCGKTYAIDRFIKQQPLHTYKITVSALYNLTDIINELLHQLQLDERGSRASKLKHIAIRLRDLKLSGHHPMIIMDEAENLKIAQLQMIKNLYDNLKDYCSIILVGTDELTDKLNRMLRKKKEGIPQFYRRFKAGIRILPDIDRSFEAFLKDKVSDRNLKNLLRKLCANYGELHDYLEPALREADIQGQPLTEEFFRAMYNLAEI